MLRDHLLDALAVLLPADCPACGLPATRTPCPDCARALAAEAHCTVRRLGPAGDPLDVVVGAPYSGVTRRLLLGLKEEGRVAAVRPLGALLRPALLRALDGAPAALVGPPGSWSRRLRRGLDPLELLVRSAGGRLERPLARTRLARDQVGLGRAERSANLDGAFRARRAMDGVEPVLLVDDVVTSGATLLELRRAVRAAGGAVRGAAALAGTRHRGSASS